MNDLGRVLRQILGRTSRWLWGDDAQPGLLGRIVGKGTAAPESLHSADARARFWAELREGQREAAQRSRVQP